MAPKVPITVLPMDSIDFPRGFEILSLAFKQDHEYFDACFPQHWTPSGRQIGGERLLAISHAQPYAVFLKALNPAGEMIGLAKYLILKDEVPEESGLGTDEFWKSKEEADYADAMYRGYLQERRAKIRETGGNVVCLDFLVVDPAHFRQGAGRALMDWGAKKADEMGVDIVVEASEYGVPAYEDSGYKKIKFVTVEPPDGFKDRPRQVFWWMIRPKKGSQ